MGYRFDLFLFYILPKVTVFFYFPGKVDFCDIFDQIEWVSKNTVFFLSNTGNKKIQTFEMSEWVRRKLFQEKKMQGKKKYRSREKKYNVNGVKNAISEKNIAFLLIFYISSSRKVEWVERKLFLGNKKIQLYFFFPSFWKKKYRCSKIWVSEWASTFPRK